MGFYAMLLCNVLFLTGVWHYSILKAGLALTPGPLTAAMTAPIGGRLSDRFGQRVVAIPGTLLFATGTLLFALLAARHGHWASDFLPANIVTGAGVGLSFAAFGSAAVAELPPAQFATGSAVAACFRQIGAVLGISVMLAIVGSHGGLGSFHEAWRLMSLAGLGATLAGIAMGRVRARVPELVAPEPAVALGAAR
jgi:MFS family permease